MDIEKLQDVLKKNSTTFVRTKFNEYCKLKGYELWNYRKEQPNSYFYSEYDCKHRFRTICRIYDNGHEMQIALRKKCGYYFLIEYDRIRIFECDPDILVLKQAKLNQVYEEYKELFDLILS